MIVVCGFSGSGTDIYLRSVMEKHLNVWLVNPDMGAWDAKAVHHVSAFASEFANSLIDNFLI
jgi:hypothetical protein